MLASNVVRKSRRYKPFVCSITDVFSHEAGSCCVSCFMLRVQYEQDSKFYKQFHRNPYNCAIHAVCVPLEWFAFLVLLSSVKLHWPISVALCFLISSMGTNMSIITGIAHLVFAFCIDSIPIPSFPRILLSSFALQVTAWLPQVLLGHIYFEGNLPSMSQKLTYSSVIFSLLLAWDE